MKITDDYDAKFKLWAQNPIAAAARSTSTHAESEVAEVLISQGDE